MLTCRSLFHCPVKYRNPLVEHVHLDLDLMPNELGFLQLILQFKLQLCGLSFFLLRFEELCAVFDDDKVPSSGIDADLSLLYFEESRNVFCFWFDHLVIQV